MYRPQLFKVEDPEIILDFIRKYSFCTFTTFDGLRPIATHIPIEARGESMEKLTLVGHISKANLQWQSFKENQEALTVFSGPHTYVSSGWYDHDNVPTWNYMAVHAYGIPQIIEGAPLLDHLNRMVSKYERPSPEPLAWEDMSIGMIKRQLRGIVGFEIKVNRIEAAFKLSQNRNQTDFENIIHKLRERSDYVSKAVAEEMEGLKDHLF
ncbi:MAG: FMN-binding negative transcriptional regulator [Bacteroidota bacterium]